MQKIVESIIAMYDCNISEDISSPSPAHDCFRVHFVNYRSLEGIELPVWGPRRLNDFELILALRGEFEFLSCDTGERVRQHPGEVLTIRPGESHIYRLESDPAGAFFSCIHLEPPVAAAGKHEAAPPPRLAAFPAELAVGELFRRADWLFHHPGNRTELLLSEVGRLIWLYLFEAPHVVNHDERLEAMLDFLERNLSTHPTRLDLARKFHLTPQRINAIFKAELGMSPGEYVHRELAERGYALLHDEQLSVKEVAARLNFSSAFYFSRIFRKVFGVPPSSV